MAYDWLISKKIIVKESTYIRYKNTIENHIKPKFGKYPINKISTELVESFIANKMQNGKKSGGGLSSKSISDIMVIIKETFKFAQSHGEKINCTFSRLSIRKATNEMRVLSISEEQKLISVISNDIDRCKLGILICLYTGIHIGELCALKCKNISIADKTLKIEATMQRLHCDDFNCTSKTKIIITDPKTYNSVRVIPLCSYSEKTEQNTLLPSIATNGTLRALKLLQKKLITHKNSLQRFCCRHFSFLIGYSCGGYEF